MSHDDYDDGLVHSHGWATEPPPPTTSARTRSAMVASAMGAHPEEGEPFDDGLVHSHRWACSDNGCNGASGPELR